MTVICNKCGYNLDELKSDDFKCPYCGAEIPIPEIKENVNPEHCAIHPDRAGEYTCRMCGYNFCSSCVTEVEGEKFCKPCLRACRVDISSVPDVEYVRESPSLIPWINRKTIGWSKAFFYTLRLIYKTPNAFYKKVKSAGTFTDSLWFGVLCGIVFWIIAIPAKKIDFDLFFSIIGTNVLKAMNMEKPPALSFDDYFSNLILMPGLILLKIYFLAALIHLGTKFFNKKPSYLNSVQIVAYAQAANLLQFIPFFVGAAAAVIYQTALISIGVIVIHKLSKAQGIFVAIFPIIFILFLTIILSGNMGGSM